MANSYKGLKYVVTFASWADAEAFIDRKVEEEKQCNNCYLDPAQPDQRDTYRIRKPL